MAEKLDNSFSEFTPSSRLPLIPVEHKALRLKAWARGGERPCLGETQM